MNLDHLTLFGECSHFFAGERSVLPDSCEKDDEFVCQYVLSATMEVTWDQVFHGKARPEFFRVSPGPHVPLSYVYICPVCGWSWGEYRILTRGTVYLVENRLCPEHGYGSFFNCIPGEDTLKDIPLEILEREFLIMLEHPDYW